MRKVTITLKDTVLLAALEQAAKETGCAIEDVAIEAVEMWQYEMRCLSELEAETAAYEAELREKGGVEAYLHAYFKMLEEDKDELRSALRRLGQSGGKEALELIQLLKEQDRWVEE